MGRPRQIYISVPDTTYSLEVDLTRYDCLKEKPHCHVCNSTGLRVGQVWLDSITFDSTPSKIANDDQNKILSTVHRSRQTLESAFLYNREHGHD